MKRAWEAPDRHRPTRQPAPAAHVVDADDGVSTQLLSFAPIAWGEHMPFDPREALVALERLCLRHGVPLAWQRNVLAVPVAAAAGLNRDRAAQSHLSLKRLLTNAGLHAMCAFERLTARSVVESEAQHLRLDINAHLVAVERSAYALDQGLIVFSEAILRAQHWREEPHLAWWDTAPLDTGVAAVNAALLPWPRFSAPPRSTRIR